MSRILSSITSMAKTKHKFTKKQDRQAAHVASSMKKKGMSAKKAKSVGYATVNKMKGKKKGKMTYDKMHKKMYGV